MFTLLPLLLIAAGTYFLYRLSPTSKARGRIHAALSAYESTDAEVTSRGQSLRTDFEQEASRYQEQVYTARIRALSVDVLKRYATGLRLQALKDVGVRTIADLRGWNEQRISQVRGVGAKSAATTFLSRHNL